MKNKAIIQAHKFSSNHKVQLEVDQNCGCFYCLKIFNSREITDWIDNDTAICPYCMIDSVMGESSGYPITYEFLEAMYQYWFLK